MEVSKAHQMLTYCTLAGQDIVNHQRISPADPVNAENVAQRGYLSLRAKLRTPTIQIVGSDKYGSM